MLQQKVFHRSDLYLQSYFNGLGTEQSEEQAVPWYQKAAEANISIAQYMLGTCYHFGKGVSPNEELALHWLRKAAEQDYVGAQSPAETQFEVG